MAGRHINERRVVLFQAAARDVRLTVGAEGLLVEKRRVKSDHRLKVQGLGIHPTDLFVDSHAREPLRISTKIYFPEDAAKVPDQLAGDAVPQFHLVNALGRDEFAVGAEDGSSHARCSSAEADLCCVSAEFCL